MFNNSSNTITAYEKTMSSSIIIDKKHI